MVELSKPFPLVFIVGPTAVGKSELALKAAQKFSGAIVNFDSLQFFSDLNIGTAKPTVEERSALPHFLFDICSVGENYTAGDFRKAALKVIEDQEYNFPLFFVGGSGFYLQALEKGMFEVSDISPEIIEETKNEQNQKGLSYLYEMLIKQDPDYAKKIEAQDSYRIFRAITLMRQLNKSMTQINKEFQLQQQTKKLNKVIFKVGLKMDRQRLRNRVQIRTDKMLELGLIEEVEDLLKIAPVNWSPLSSVGYKEVISYLKGEYNRTQMREWIITHTMQLAKRQMTWFQRDKEVEWFESTSEALNFLGKHLTSET